MRRHLVWIAIVAMAAMVAVLVGCGGGATQAPKDSAIRQLIRSSSGDGTRPAWTLEVPEQSGDTLFFIGLSPYMATESMGRDRAERDGRNKVVQYMGTLVKDKHEQATVDFGLSSDVIDPTQSARQFNKQLAVNLATHVKARKYYWEQWMTPTGEGFQVFALMAVPTNAMSEAYQQSAAQMAQDAARKAKAQSNQIAKQQLEKASEMWGKLKAEGLFDD